jgi:hypothetical protein
LKNYYSQKLSTLLSKKERQEVEGGGGENKKTFFSCLNLLKKIFLKVVECPVADQLPPPPSDQKRAPREKGQGQHLKQDPIA